jgi:hypothetical protein
VSLCSIEAEHLPAERNFEATFAMRLFDAIHERNVGFDFTGGVPRGLAVPPVGVWFDVLIQGELGYCHCSNLTG